MRTFGVEEELLLVDAQTLEPLPAGEQAVGLGGAAADTGHRLSTELQQEQIEVDCPPQTTLDGQLAAIRTGRALADAAAVRVGGRVVALPTAPGPVAPHIGHERRAQLVSARFGLTAREQLTCGFHVHVAVGSREEGVAVLDRIRVWLPVLLALSSNSPFWNGADSGYSSFRYQAWSRWPTAGPPETFGSAAAYDRHRQDLLSSGVPLDGGMLYFDARLCEHLPTLEVRVADVCLDARHAAVLAALTRALVEHAARDWRAGAAAPEVRASVLRAWMWQASHTGVRGPLVSPVTRTLGPAADVVAQLLEVLHPVLTEHGEAEQIGSVVAEILHHGSGARRQREAFRAGGVLAVVRMAIEATHSTASPAA
ncbi:glutamate--cysteine ligase [Kocuria arenosa]|uniref:glutamate--cysteine ligase n=1 Tax=Kocuria arenosa TaxID=3071446 RepID=UPI0034D6C4B9